MLRPHQQLVLATELRLLKERAPEEAQQMRLWWAFGEVTVYFWRRFPSGSTLKTTVGSPQVLGPLLADYFRSLRLSRVDYGFAFEPCALPEAVRAAAELAGFMDAHAQVLRRPAGNQWRVDLVLMGDYCYSED